MCKVIRGDNWSLNIYQTFEGYYFALVVVGKEERRTHRVYVSDDLAVDAGLEMLSDMGVDVLAQYGGGGK